jgi:hypothetical protein
MKYLFLIITILLINSCSEGLKVDIIEDSYLRGTIYYKNGANNWPDSVVAVRVGAFKTDDPSNFQLEVLTGNVYVDFNSLPLRVDSTNFELLITDPPVELKYIAVALQKNTDIFNQQIIGIYTITGDKSQPGSIMIEKGKSVNNIKIEVDFDNLPPQPFGN